LEVLTIIADCGVEQATRDDLEQAEQRKCKNDPSNYVQIFQHKKTPDCCAEVAPLLST
jgi:hypothetical protein